MKKKLAFSIFIILFLILLVIIFHYQIFYFITEILWWNSISLLSVYIKFILLKVLPFICLFVFTLFSLFFWFQIIRKKSTNVFIILSYLIISIVAGVWGINNWKFLLYNFGLYSSKFKDPIFNINSNFYINQLPLIKTIINYLIILFLFILIIDLFVGDDNKREEEENGFKIKLSPTRFFLFLFNFILISCLLVLKIFEKLIQKGNIRLGIDFTEYYGYLLGYGLWVFILIFIFLILLIKSLKGVRIKTIFLNTIILVILYFLLNKIYPYLLKNYFVLPNELFLQRKFIKNRIISTREGFNLKYDSIFISSFITNQKSDIESTIKKVRIWDSNLYKKVIKELQEIKNYFEFNDVDVGFYELCEKYISNNNTNYLTNIYQVLISARELNINEIPENAKIWDNIHLRYTHGNGIVVSPANLIDKEGNPIFWVQDLDNSTIFNEFLLEFPQIYFGELTSNYIIIKTTTEEFEYSISTNRITSSYILDKGILLNNFFIKFIYSVILKEKNILFSQYYKNDSRLIYNREILQRVRKIFPYLYYDPDPYICIIDKKLFWIIDAYTISSRFPLSEIFTTIFGDINYIRNSVKVIVDAYTGDVHYFVVDKEDPFIQSYLNIFPELFKTEIPDKFKKHFRYPYNFMKIQAQVLTKYHVDNEDSFFNGDEYWEIPKVILNNKEESFEPYYFLGKYNNKEILSVFHPFIYRGRKNLSSWIEGYYDNKLNLILYYIDPKSGTYGPLQVQSKINQDDTLSTLLTLWGQKYSLVSRGNIKFIPIGNKILYIEPIFIEAEKASIPQLIKLSAFYDGKVYLGNTPEDIYNQIKLLSITTN